MAFVDPFKLSLARRMIAQGKSLSGQPEAEDEDEPALSAEAETSLLSELGSRTGQFVEAVGTVLDTPGAIARGVLAGKPLSGFSTNTADRVTGEQLLDSYGLKPENPYGSALASFGVNIATDPLTYLNPFKALGTAGQAASKAGLLQYAPLVAQTKRGAEATKTGLYTANAIKRIGLDPKLGSRNATLQARPLLGPRLSQSVITLEEAVNAAPDTQKALRDVQLALGSVPYDSVKNQRLGGSVGWQSLFGGKSGLFKTSEGVVDSLDDLTTYQRLADRMDKLGQQVSWSAPVRKIASYTDQRVAGPDSSELAQIINLRNWDQAKASASIGRRLVTEHANKLANISIPANIAKSVGFADFFNSAKANDAVLRIVENHPTASDKLLLQNAPGLQQWADDWKQIAADHNANAKSLGMTSSELSDPKGFGTNWSPRSAQELEIISGGGGGSGAKYSANIRNQQAREANLKTPNATIDLRELSVDPFVRKYMNLTDQDVIKGAGSTDRQIGEYIAKKINNPQVDVAQSIQIARTLRRLKPNTADDYAVFATHPIINQGNYIMGEAQRTANVKSMYEILGDSAKKASFVDLGGGKHISAAAALKKIGKSIGLAEGRNGGSTAVGRNNLRNAILNAAGAPTGSSISDIKLKEYSIPESVVNTLMTRNEFMKNKKVQNQAKSLLDQYTTLFKGFVLAWPATKVRDSYSNVFSSWLETNDIQGTLQGFNAARHILANNWDKAMPFLKTIPRYEGMINDPAALRNAVISDVGGAGVLTGLTSNDLLSSSQRGDISQFVPGSTPISISSGLKQMLPTGQNSPLQMLKDFGTIKGVGSAQVTKNPLLMASQEVGDTVDSMGRLGTFLALSKNRVAPEEAASRVKKALVDYSSLTGFERDWARSIFPWYAYQSRMGKYVAEHLINNPGGAYGKTIRFSHDMQAADEDTYVPAALKQQFALRVPFLSTPGTNTFVTDFDLPGFDIWNNIRVQSQENPLRAASQSVLATGRNVAFNMHPAARAATELLTGIDAYSGDTLDQASTPLRRLMKSGGAGDFYDPLLNIAINAVPGLQRPMSLAGALFTGEKESAQLRGLKAGINNLSGIKIKTVDEKAVRRDLLEKLGEELSPVSLNQSKRYVPKDRVPTLTKAQMAKYLLQKKLEKAARDEAKKERAQKAAKSALASGTRRP